MCGCRGRSETRDGFLKEKNKTLRKRDRKKAVRARSSSILYVDRITCTARNCTGAVVAAACTHYNNTPHLCTHTLRDKMQVLVSYRLADDGSVFGLCFVYLHMQHPVGTYLCIYTILHKWDRPDVTFFIIVCFLDCFSYSPIEI